jgi:hypothetical protein
LWSRSFPYLIGGLLKTGNFLNAKSTLRDRIKGSKTVKEGETNGPHSCTRSNTTAYAEKPMGAKQGGISQKRLRPKNTEKERDLTN